MNFWGEISIRSTFPYNLISHLKLITEKHITNNRHEVTTFAESECGLKAIGAT